MENYQENAKKLLDSLGVKFTAEYLKHGKHFADDKDTRDIYKITLQRGKRIYTFNFGQSLANSGEYIVKDTNPRLTKTFAIKADAIRYASKIGNSFNVAKNPSFAAPNEYDVMACLTKYDPGTFEDFCSEFGYDTDSKKAEKVYQGVKDEWQNMQALFTDAELEQLAEIQ